MGAPLTNLFDSPAVPLLLALEAREIRVQLTTDGHLIVEPASRLTPVEQVAVRRYARGLALLIRICDRDVQERREAFAEQVAHTPPPRLPALVFRPSVPYVNGTCYSCGVSLHRPTFGRCWRCALASRLTTGLSLSHELLIALDSARFLA